jgi:hypothetical protein
MHTKALPIAVITTVRLLEPPMIPVFEQTRSGKLIFSGWVMKKAA